MPEEAEMIHPLLIPLVVVATLFLVLGLLAMLFRLLGQAEDDQEFLREEDK